MRTRIALFVLVAAVPAIVHADPEGCIRTADPLPHLNCLPPDHPPENLAASYDGPSQTLTLAWDAPAGTTAPDSYVVFRDDVRWATPTTTTVSDDLTGFQGTHSYVVRAVWGTATSDASWPVMAAKSGSGCIGISTGFPYVVVQPQNCP